MTVERFVDNGDIRLRVEVTGDGPTILFVHGWPELAYSWRHQVRHLADGGYRTATMDVRGYGGSSAPVGIEHYTLRALSSDVAAVAAALDDNPVVLVGHDWGAPIVYTTAIRFPERVRAVAGLSVTHTPPMAASLVDLFDRMYADRFFYMLYFQEPGVAEAEFESDVRGALKKVFYAGSAAAPRNAFLAEGPRRAAFLPLLPEPPKGPLPFLADADLDVYAETFARTGFTGAFNRYRALALDAGELADIEGARVSQPACFIAGAADMVRSMVPGLDAYARADRGLADSRGVTIIEGAGHWIQQEAPDQVNAALLRFLESVSDSPIA